MFPSRILLLQSPALLLLVLLLTPGYGAAQEELPFLSDPSFAKDQRPPSRFGHTLHMELVEECATCHHLYEGGRKIPDADSVGMSCSECHAPAPEDGTTPLRQAFHLQCKNCHLEQSAGPVGCGECHVK